MEAELRALFHDAYYALPPSGRRGVREALERNERTIRRHLTPNVHDQTRLSVDDIPTYVEALKISADDLLKALLPELPDGHSTTTSLKFWQMRAQSLEAELAARRSGAVNDLDLVEDITATGRWAVGILPHRSGPTPKSEVLTGTRLAITPARPGLLEPGVTVRSALIAEFGALIRDRAVFLADSVRPLPRPPVEAAANEIVYLSIPAFTKDRNPIEGAFSLPKLRRESVAVVALTSSAWRGDVAAIAARALGWGIMNSSSRGRSATPVRDGDRDDFVESMNKVHNDGLHQLLLDAPTKTFIHHAGRDVVREPAEKHALVELAKSKFRDRLPYIVLLSESDRMIRRQEKRVRRYDSGEPRFTAETWMGWRDELRVAVESLDAEHRLILDVDLPWEPQNEADDPLADAGVRNQLQWGRSARHAKTVVEQLLGMGTVGRRQLPNFDPEAKLLLESVSLFGSG